MTTNIASDEEIQAMIAAIEEGGEDDLLEIDRVLTLHPNDPRLHFMRGSILAGRQEIVPAHEALSRAVEIAPDFDLARYQLGLLELTSGKSDTALQTWSPLLRLGKDAYLRRFVEGMVFLIRDEFEDAIGEFVAGIELNKDNEPMNSDIRLIMNQCRDLISQGGERDESRSEISTTTLILSQFRSRTIQ